MTRCIRCNRFLFFSSQSGYCSDCEVLIKQEKEALRRAEEKRKRQEEKARREAEEERKRIEQERKAAQYEKAITLFARTMSVEEVETVKQTFNKLSDFQESVEWIRKCDERIDLLKARDERSRKEEEEKRLKAEEEQKKATEELKKAVELVNSKYSIGDVVYWGSYGYRDYIKWHLIDIDGINGLLLSDEILDSHIFHSVNNESIVIKWEMSDLRKWMNKTMLNEMFSDKERKSIQISTIKNGNCYGKKLPDTTDRLFLLSLDELKQYKCEDILSDYTKGWWLRTKGKDLCENSVGTLYVGKLVDSERDWINTLGPTWSRGVRPALWVNLVTASIIDEEEMERIRKEEEERQRKEEEERQRKAEEERQRKEEEERRRKEEQEREEERKRQEEEQKRKEAQERERKEKEELRSRLKDVLHRKEIEKQQREQEEQKYNEEEKQFSVEAETWAKEQSEKANNALICANPREADMQQYSFAGEKFTSKKALVYALNENWDEAKKHMIRGLVLEHFKRDFDADVISNLMDIDEDSSTDDQDIKIFRYLYSIDASLRELLWKKNIFIDVSDFGLQCLKAIKYNQSAFMEVTDEVIEKDVLLNYLTSIKSTDDELLSRIADCKTYLEEIKTKEAEDCRIKRMVLAYSLVKNKEEADPVMYSFLVHEKRKAVNLPLTDRVVALNKVMNALTVLGSYEDSIAIIQECQECLNDANEILLKYKVGSTIPFGSFWQGKDQSEGKTDLDWIVLDVQQNKALLICKYAIYAYPYAHSEGLGGNGAEWSKSYVREWLNNEFYCYAFNMEEQATIMLTDVDNSVKQHNFSMRSKFDRSSENTKDKVFLLSYAETWKYFPDEQSRKCYETEFAYNEAKRYGYGPPQCGLIWWWLRSPGYLNNGAPIVDEKGKFDLDNVSDISGGIRPVVWIDVDPDYEWLKDDTSEPLYKPEYTAEHGDGEKTETSHISEEATKKAQEILMGKLGEARIFAMAMNMNMKSPNADYFFLRDCIISLLVENGTMTSEEIGSVDFDRILEPFVDEIDSDDDMHIRQVKQSVMQTIRSHKA